mgnify:CR=1 FL=1
MQLRMLSPSARLHTVQGSYDRGAYKSIYFNMERETVYLLLVRRHACTSCCCCAEMRRLLRPCKLTYRAHDGAPPQMTVGYATLAYEGLRQAFALMYHKRPLDLLMVVATIFTVYPNFYSFFCTWNYINDRFFDMMATQVQGPIA